MLDRIRSALLGSVPAADPAAAALGSLPPGVAGELFRSPLVPAAVLVALVEGPEGESVLLTRRTAHLRDHGGQISFPGGRVDAEDPDVRATALREAEEEVGLHPRDVEVIGYLPPIPVVTGFAISPVVGIVPVLPVLRPHPGEVAEAFLVPLTFLADPRNLQTGTRRAGGLELPVRAWDYAGRRIWGATAQILWNLCSYAFKSSQ